MMIRKWDFLSLALMIMLHLVQLFRKKMRVKVVLMMLNKNQVMKFGAQMKNALKMIASSRIPVKKLMTSCGEFPFFGLFSIDAEYLSELWLHFSLFYFFCCLT